jgi:Kdo2-lipid IVA lauroyltransferase/acyltransferase
MLGQCLGRAATHAGIAFMKGLAFLPLPAIRALGTALGWVLYTLIASRRHVVQANFAVCFPQLSTLERRRLGLRTFVYFSQAWLDRAWLWHAPKQWVQRRVRLTGALEELQGTDPTVIFLPHFVGLDAAWAGMALALPRASTTIYTDQSNKLIDQWILQGRQRFGHLRLFGRIEGVKPIIAALRQGQPLYLLPDMDFGPDESVFVPFYGLPTATVPSLSRFARLGRAKVVPLLPRLTARGCRHGANERQFAGLHRQHAGAVLLGSQTLQDPARRRAVGVLSGPYRLRPGFKPFDAVAL